MKVLVEIPAHVLESIDALRVSTVDRAMRRIELRRQRETANARLRTLPVEALRRIHDEAMKGHAYAEKATKKEREAHHASVMADLAEINRQLAIVGEHHVPRTTMINKLLAEALLARGALLPE